MMAGMGPGAEKRARRRPSGRSLPVAVAAVAMFAGATGTAAGATAPRAGVPAPVGPAVSSTGNGRHLNPAGRLSTVGDFPTGGALTPDGRFYWAIDAGHGKDDARIVDVASGTVTQVLPLPGAYVGVAFAPDGRTAYVSGEPVGDSHPTGPTLGDGGDVIHVFAVDRASGHATEQTPIALPRAMGGTAQSHAGQTLGFPGPTAGQALDWPEGMAVSPDGRRLVVALNQADQAAVIDLPGNRVRLVPTGTYPYGAAVSRDSRTAYVTNEQDGTLSVIDLDSATNRATIGGLGGPDGDRGSHPEGIVADPGRDRLYVAVASRDLVDVVDPASRQVVDRVSVQPGDGLGAEPVALAVAPDGQTLYSADAGEDAVAAISLVPRPRRGARAVALAPSLASLRRYRSVLAALRRRRLAPRARHRALVALNRRALRIRTRQACAGPTRGQVGRYRRRVLSLLARGARRAPGRRARTLARALRRARRGLPASRACTGAISGLGADALVGKLPTAAYPSAVSVSPDGRKLVWLAAKGLGAGPNVDYGVHFANSDAAPYGTYVPDLLLGRVGVLDRPTDVGVRALSVQAETQTRPANAQPAPPSTPVVGPGGGASQQIRHVFYVVKENRTYDQLFGSEPRGDGDPALELFDDNGTGTPAGGVTPNAHALERSFGLLDEFFANSEVSVDGHQITSGGYAIDYVQKALHPNYSNRGRVDEFGSYPVSLPPKGYLFDQAARQGISFLNLGEQSAGIAPTADDGRSTYAVVKANSPTDYPTIFGCAVPVVLCNTDHGSLGGVGTPYTSRVDNFRGNLSRQLAAGAVPDLTYITLPNDHTNGVQSGFPTPRALVADNDLALGQLVDVISHSPIWSSSAIFVAADDSQDGADHVDAHRMPALVISPWARRGAVVHTRYDQESMIHTIELILGLRPLGLFDAQATPMYDAFVSGGAGADTTPYGAISPDQSLSETTSLGQARAAGPLAAALPYGRTDVVPQELFDGVLWRSVYGPDSVAPGPGPNASPEEAGRAAGALSVLRRRGDVARWLLRRNAPPPNGGTDR